MEKPCHGGSFRRQIKCGPVLDNELGHNYGFIYILICKSTILYRAAVEWGMGDKDFNLYATLIEKSFFSFPRHEKKLRSVVTIQCLQVRC